MHSPRRLRTNRRSIKPNNGECCMKTFAALATIVAVSSWGALTSTAAQASDVAAARLIPPYEVLTIIRSMGFDPAGGPPALQGSVYVVRAFDADDVPVRVAVNARTGQVMNVTEIMAGGYGPPPMRRGAYPVPPGSTPQGSVSRAAPDYGPPRPPSPYSPVSSAPPPV